MTIRNVAILSKYIKIKKQDIKSQKIYRTNKPLSIPKARKYGYKDTPEYISVIGSYKKGGIEPKIPSRGRTPSGIYSKYSRNISLDRILEKKVSKKYQNLKIVGYYWIYEDGKRKWYEFILKDTHANSDKRE